MEELGLLVCGRFFEGFKNALVRDIVHDHLRDYEDCLFAQDQGTHFDMTSGKPAPSFAGRWSKLEGCISRDMELAIGWSTSQSGKFSPPRTVQRTMIRRHGAIAFKMGWSSRVLLLAAPGCRL